VDKQIKKDKQEHTQTSHCTGAQMISDAIPDAGQIRFNEKLLEAIKVSSTDINRENQLVLIKLGNTSLLPQNDDLSSFVNLLKQSGIITDETKSNIIVTGYDVKIEEWTVEQLNQLISEKLKLKSSRLNDID
jgi:hypothetical protein